MELNCPVCFELLYKPVSLICQHNLCRFCQMGMADRAQTKEKLLCPLCRDRGGHFSAQYLSHNRLLDQFIKKECPKEWALCDAEWTKASQRAQHFVNLDLVPGQVMTGPELLQLFKDKYESDPKDMYCPSGPYQIAEFCHLETSGLDSGSGPDPLSRFIIKGLDWFFAKPKNSQDLDLLDQTSRALMQASGFPGWLIDQMVKEQREDYEMAMKKASGHQDPQ